MDAAKVPLSGDELVLLRFRPHWRVIVGPVVVGMALLVVLLVSWFALPNTIWGWAGRGTLAILGGGLLVRSVVLFIRWFMSVTTITDHRVLARTPTQERQVEVARLSLPVVRRTGVDILFGTGTLELGDGTRLLAVPRVMRVQRLLSELYSGRGRDVQQLEALLSRMGYGSMASERSAVGTAKSTTFPPGRAADIPQLERTIEVLPGSRYSVPASGR